MADLIQETSSPKTNSAVDDLSSKQTKPVPAKRPTIIRATLVASGSNSGSNSTESIGQEQRETSNELKPKQPPPRPAARPSRPTSIYKPETAPNAETVVTSNKTSPSSVNNNKPETSPTVPVRKKTSFRKSKKDSKVTKRRPEIKVVSARPLSEVIDAIGFGTKPIVSKRLSLDMDSSSATPGAPPPLPSSRPRGKYVPPPLPTSRPKAAYVHPVSTPSSGSSTPDLATTPVLESKSTHNHNHVNASATSGKPSLPPHPAIRPKSWLSESDHTSAPERPTVTHKPTIVAKPHFNGSSSGGNEPVAVPRPSQRTSAPGANYHPPLPGKPAITTKPASPPKQTSMNELLSMFGSSSSHSKPAAQPPQQQKNTSSSDLGWQIASGIANNITAKDVQRGAAAVSAAASSETGRKFGNAAVKSASSSSDTRLQFAGSAAQNINARDVSRAADTAGKVAASEQGQKAASSAWNFAENNKETINAAFSNSTSQNGTAGKTKSNSNLDLFGMFSSTAPSQSAAVSKSSKSNSLDDLLGFDPVPLGGGNNKPKPSTGLLPPPGPSASRAGAKSRPTIIRPGANKSNSKPNSRSASPKMELEGLDLGGLTKGSKKPPPRPSAGPQKRAAPPRPGAPVASSRKPAPSHPAGGGIKPKRIAPSRPAPGKPGAPRKTSHGTIAVERPKQAPRNSLGSDFEALAQIDFVAQTADKVNFKGSDFEALAQLDFEAQAADKMTFKSLSNPSMTGPRAVAVFSYDATSPDDLSFQEGGNIKLLEKISEEWYRGEFKGQTGLFPANFVNVIEDVKPSFGMAKLDVDSGPRCKATFDYDSSQPGDLVFQSGDVIRLLEHVGGDWLKGELYGITGIFPSSFVDIVEDVVVISGMASSSTPAINGTSSGNTAKAVYDFDAADSTEISFKDGDTITVLNRVSAEWLYGEVRGQKGKFPATFVDHVPDNLSVLSTPTDSSPSGSGMEETSVAQFDFDAGDESELTFRTGDVIIVLEHVGDDWLRGRLNGREGLFPKAFVKIEAGSSGVVGSGFNSSVTGTAMYDFDGENSEELSFKTGDTIKQINKYSEEWWEGQLNGKKGRFPAAFVEVTS